MRKIGRKAFTLVELIIVVGILGILATIGINRLTTMNADKYYSEVCINTVYARVSDFVYKAATSQILPKCSQSIEKGGELPLSYDIVWQNESGHIALEGVYDDTNEQGQTGREECTEETIDISLIKECGKGKRYKVNMISDFHRVKIAPSLYTSKNDPLLAIRSIDNAEEGTLSTGALHLKFCSPADVSQCSEFAQILFDARTGMVKKRFCKLYNNEEGEKHSCKEWSTGS